MNLPECSLCDQPELNKSELRGDFAKMHAPIGKRTFLPLQDGKFAVVL